ncbi:MAG: PAS domain-containing protein [Planctomycetota bacterium]|nr:MAG: PAS domain-containing protein [Planctomycetota bacterium]
MQKLHVTNGKSGFGWFGKKIFETLPVGIVAFDRNLKITDANPHAAKLIDLTDKIDKSLQRGTDGSASASQDWSQQLESVILTGKARTFESVRYTSNGKTKLLRIACAALKKTGTGKNCGGTIIIEDITEQVNTRCQLANAERLATVGKLASRVAHELNNPMDGILRYINLALRTIEKQDLEKPKEYLTHCREGLVRMVQIVSELLEFSRNTYSPFEHVRIEQIVEDSIKTMDTKGEASKVKILRNYASDIPEIRSGNLFQVFCNLTKNALDAMPNGGELNISTRMSAKDTAAVEFRDTGVGFDAEEREVIFEPFFTTKDRGKGTGLGLAICKDIVERYGGKITADMAPKGGSIFTVYLPVRSENT